MLSVFSGFLKVGLGFCFCIFFLMCEWFLFENVKVAAQRHFDVGEENDASHSVQGLNQEKCVIASCF